MPLLAAMQGRLPEDIHPAKAVQRNLFEYSLMAILVTNVWLAQKRQFYIVPPFSRSYSVRPILPQAKYFPILPSATHAIIYIMTTKISTV